MSHKVGFHGRDVDQIIRDLVDTSINLTKKLRTDELKDAVQQLVEESPQTFHFLPILTIPGFSEL